MKKVLKILGILLSLVILLMTSSCLYTLGKEELASRERNKPADQNFTFLGDKYHIPAGELDIRVVPSERFVGGKDTWVDRSSLKLPYLFGSLRVFEPDAAPANYSYSNLSDTSDPYERYGDIVEYNEDFVFAPRLKKQGANAVFISRDNMFLGQRVVLRCYENGLKSECILQTYLPLSETKGSQVAIEDILEFRHRDKPCKKKPKCTYIDDVLESLPPALVDVEKNLSRWRENAGSLPE